VNARDLAILLADGGRAKPSAGQWMVCCPAHDDTTPSLSVADGHSGPVIKCFAGCDNDTILEARGLTWREVLDDEESGISQLIREPVIYEYRDAQGKAVFEVVRQPNKQFRQRQRSDSEPSGYQWNLRGVTRVLYHLPDVIRAVNQGHEVWITEGEKDADAVREHGVCATTNSGGAGKWLDQYTEYLTDASVTIWADADEPGRVHARDVRDRLLPIAGQVRIVEAQHGSKDAYAHFLAGYGLDDVLVTVPYQPVEVPELFLRLDEFIDKPRERDPWVIPTLMRRGELLVLTGFEGMGKSALMKQIAVTAAIGTHPFNTLVQKDTPARVVYIDCENPDDDCADDFARLRTAAVRDATYFKDPPLFVRPRQELDLGRPGDLAWLVERVHAHQPDLLVIGPLYGLIGTDVAKEDAVHTLKRGLTQVQATCNCAMVLEHHSPHKATGEDRGVRPYGSSLLMRWPSFGFGLLPSEPGNPNAPFEFAPWRGARRRGRSWPDYVRQATNGWFWEECKPPA
jgi:hypothetical protein